MSRHRTGDELRQAVLIVLGFVLVLAGASRCSEAQAAQSSGPRAARLTWAAPTQNTDGTAISGPLAYRVYRGPAGTLLEAKQLLLQTAELQALLTREPLGRQCYQLTAVNQSGDESDPTAEACKTMVLNAPTDGAIEVTTSAQEAIMYTLRFRQADAQDVVGNRIRIRPANTAAAKDEPFEDVPAPTPDEDGYSRIVLDDLQQAQGLDGRYDVHVSAIDDAGNEGAFLEVDNQVFDFVPPPAPTDGAIEQS